MKSGISDKVITTQKKKASLLWSMPLSPVYSTELNKKDCSRDLLCSKLILETETRHYLENIMRMLVII